MAARAWMLLAGALLLSALTSAAPAGAAPLAPQIHTASAAAIGEAKSVAALPGGGFLYVDYSNNEVFQQSASGHVTLVAGNGTTADAPDGTLATQSGLDGPVAVAPVPGGGFLITEYNGAIVRLVSAGGPSAATISTIAGTGTPGNNGLSGSATQVELDYPSDAELTPGGQVLIADTGNGLIRLVSAPAPGATLATIGGGGTCDDTSPSCNGLWATAISLHQPVSVSPLQDGSGAYLIAESDYLGANTVREISQMSSSGTFTTVAGIPGQSGAYGGDGGPATAAELNRPGQVMSLAGGGFLIADTGNERIRQVSPSGTITTVAGDGAASYAGDGGDATAAALNGPAAISTASDSDGSFLIADAYNGAVREVTIPPTSTITLGGTPGINGWYISAVGVTVTANEGATTRCELDPPQAPPVFDAMYSSCLAASLYVIDTPGPHVIYAASVNAAGDKENPISATVKVELTAPTLTCIRGRPFRLGAAHARVTAKVIDTVAGPLVPIASAPARTRHPGRHTVTLIGESNAGSINSTDCSYDVLPASFKPMPRLQSSFAGTGTVSRLALTAVPWAARVDVACSGAGCPLLSLRDVSGHSRRRRGTRTVDLTPLFKTALLSPAAKLTVTLTAPDTIGQAWVLSPAHGRVHQSCVAPASWILPKRCV